MNQKNTFQTFEDLEAYQAARAFRKQMYQIAKDLPEIEKFGLASQIRRAAVSLTNNIAEGHGRYHYLDQIKFMLQARGSLQELIDDLNQCIDQNYSSSDQIRRAKEDAWRVSQVLGGYIRHLRKCRSGESLCLRDEPVEYRTTDDLEELCGVAQDPDVTMQRFNDVTEAARP